MTKLLYFCVYLFTTLGDFALPYTLSTFYATQDVCNFRATELALNFYPGAEVQLRLKVAVRQKIVVKYKTAMFVRNKWNSISQPNSREIKVNFPVGYTY